MTRKIAYVAAALLATVAMAQGPGASLLGKYAKALSNAKTLTAEYTVQPLGGAPIRYKVELSKPNLAKIDSDTELVVSDGKEVVTYDKKAKTYLKLPYTPELLAEKLSGVNLALWSPFFQPKAFEKVQTARALGNRTRKGVTYSAVEIAWPGKLSQGTLYLTANDSLMRQAEWTIKDVNGDQTVVLDTKTLKLDGQGDASAFAFKAPDGSRQVTLEELNAAKWYKSYDEALAEAAKTNKLVFIDFYTDWCHWCKELRKNVFSTEEFKALSKYYVFCEIDAEAEVALARRFNVSAYPTCVITDNKGNLVHQIIGYKEAGPYVAEMKQVAGK